MIACGAPQTSSAAVPAHARRGCEPASGPSTASKLSPVQRLGLPLQTHEVSQSSAHAPRTNGLGWAGTRRLRIEIGGVLMRHDLAAHARVLEDHHGLQGQRLDDAELGDQRRELWRARELVEDRHAIVQRMPELVDSRLAVVSLGLEESSDLAAGLEEPRILGVTLLVHIEGGVDRLDVGSGDERLGSVTQLLTRADARKTRDYDEAITLELGSTLAHVCRLSLTARLGAPRVAAPAWPAQLLGLCMSSGSTPLVTSKVRHATQPCGWRLRHPNGHRGRWQARRSGGEVELELAWQQCWQTMTSAANTRASNRAHGCRDAGLLPDSSTVASPSNNKRCCVGSWASGAGGPHAITRAEGRGASLTSAASRPAIVCARRSRRARARPGSRA